MTQRKRGLQLRQAVNESIRKGRVFYERIGEDRYRAEVSFTYKSTPFSNQEEFGYTQSCIPLQIEFTPGKLDYNGCHVFNFETPFKVDWKSYRWAVRELGEHLTMEKIKSGLDEEDDV